MMGLRDVAPSISVLLQVGCHFAEALCAAVYYDDDSVGALFTRKSHIKKLVIQMDPSCNLHKGT